MLCSAGQRDSSGVANQITWISMTKSSLQIAKSMVHAHPVLPYHPATKSEPSASVRRAALEAYRSQEAQLRRDSSRASTSKTLGSSPCSRSSGWGPQVGFPRHFPCKTSPSFGEGSPTKIDSRKEEKCPYPNLSTGGPSRKPPASIDAFARLAPFEPRSAPGSSGHL